MNVTPGTMLADLPGLTAPLAKALAEEGVETAEQLLFRLPARFEDRSQVRAVSGGADEAVLFQGHILGVRLRWIGGRRSVFDITLVDEGEGNLGGSLTARWFNMPYMQKVFAAGQSVFLYGRIKRLKDALFMDHPEWEEREGEGIHMARITPVYRLRGGARQKALRACVHQVLAHCVAGDWPDLLRPPSKSSPFAGMNRFNALRAAHFPETMEQADQAARYLALEDFYQLQVRLLGRRSRRSEGHAPKLEKVDDRVRRFLTQVGFSLTKGQKDSLREVLRDMGGSNPMNRLLQGDVGSGKTVVALAAVVRAVEAGKRAVIMAPTQILATQTHALCEKWFGPLGMRVGLRTGRQGKNRTPEQPVDVWVGTHALLYDGWDDDNLGLIVIDEQHRFGVEQRGRLLERAASAHVLAMTATPIPRTLMLTLHGDMDVSVIREKPPGRGRVKTAVRAGVKDKEIASWLKTRFERGEQAYLVHPLVEESAVVDAAAATKALGRWEKLLAPAQVALLTGKTKADEKDRVMSDFRDNKIQALVATQVIEVGVDVPNATAMLIFHADRFGLAQLHQLRGRVGRGSGDSWCLLFPGKGRDLEKLSILEKTDDGFLIAEEDLKRRGPGDLLGRVQSGFPEIRFSGFLADMKLLHTARKLAEETVRTDPGFLDPRNNPLKRLWELDDGARD